MANYVTQADLIAALTHAVFIDLFDDDNDGVVSDSDANVTAVITNAHAEVESYLPNLYTTLPTNSPVLLKNAERDFAIAYALDRKPQVARTYGAEARDHYWNRAEKRMERIQKSIQRLIDNTPTGDPANVGGIVRSGDPDDTDVEDKWFATPTGMGDW